MAKAKTVFSCQQCGQTYSKWMGRCQECGEWNSVVEESSGGNTSKREAGKAGDVKTAANNTPRRISEVVSEDFQRWSSGVSELDNVLGGGLVPGSVVLVGGEPGVGKSTLLLQAANDYAQKGMKVLYVSGEESVSQIALRASRLGVESTNLYLLAETELEPIEGHIEKLVPQVLILDSIQTLYSGQLESQPGSVGQLRECTFALVELAKQRHMAIFVVGHVTKEGSIAGPKVLEHMVDVVLYFEGTSTQAFRLLRSMKNRFGSTHEIGVFEMVGKGVRPVSNPSELFLSERPSAIPGSVVVATLEGTRSILVEVQALVSSTSLAIPRRTSIGLDPNRVSLLVAILEKRGGFRLFDQDVYVNIAGGLRLQETAADLGVVAALISSYTGKRVEPGTFFFGEVGLGGEVRSVPRATERIKEGAHIGLKRAFVPSKVKKEVGDLGVELINIDHVQELGDKL